MARELVLIPKTKYEHLLKLSEKVNLTEKEINKQEQIGGQLKIDTKENINDTINEVPENDQTRELSKMDTNANKTAKEDKPRFYVHKPFKKMPFKSKRLDVKSKRAPKKYYKKQDAATTQKRVKWINYVV